MSNEITAYFKGTSGVSESVYQFDYGMILIIDGPDLTAPFEVHFEHTGGVDAVTAIGQDNRVAIPNACLALPGRVTAYIYDHTGQHDGQTAYVVRFQVMNRARPVDDVTDEQDSAISKAIALLAEPIDNIETIVNEALAMTGTTLHQLEEQFNTAIHAVTTDTEVTNIRVGDDGVTYNTAGQAVREQFSNLKSEINVYRENIFSNSLYELGYFLDYGGTPARVSWKHQSSVGYTGLGAVLVQLQEGHRYTISNIDCPRFRVGIFNTKPGSNEPYADETLVVNGEIQSVEYYAEAPVWLGVFGMQNNTYTSIRILDGGKSTLFGDIENSALGQKTVSQSDMIQGSYYTKEWNEIYPSNRTIRTKVALHCYKGDVLRVKMGTMCNQSAIGYWDKNGKYVNERGWDNASEYIANIENECFVVVALRNTVSDISPSDYDAEITVYTSLGKKVSDITDYLEKEDTAFSGRDVLHSIIRKTNDATELVWSLGYINRTDGMMRYDKANIVTPMFLFVKAGTTLQSVDGNKYAVVFYHSPRPDSRYDYLGSRTNAWTFSEDCFIRIFMFKSDVSEVTDITALAESLQITNGYIYYLEPYIYADTSPAENNPPAVNKFIDKMNEKAQKIGMTNSLFADVAGYDTDTNKTTARDLVRLGIEACAYNRLCSVWNTDEYTITTLDKNHRTIVCTYTDDLTELNNAYTVLGKKAGYMPLSGGGSTYTMLAVCVVGDDVVVGAIGGATSRENRPKAIKELMDKVANHSSETPTYYTHGCACVLPKGNPASYAGKNIDFVYEYDADTRFVPASTTKTLTAITALDYITDMHEKMTVISDDGLNYGSGQLIQAGDVLNYEQALYLMMLPSSGPTCRVVARNVGQKMLIAYE